MGCPDEDGGIAAQSSTAVINQRLPFSEKKRAEFPPTRCLAPISHYIGLSDPRSASATWVRQPTTFAWPTSSGTGLSPRLSLALVRPHVGGSGTTCRVRSVKSPLTRSIVWLQPRVKSFPTRYCHAPGYHRVQSVLPLRHRPLLGQAQRRSPYRTTLQLLILPHAWRRRCLRRTRWNYH